MYWNTGLTVTTRQLLLDGLLFMDMFNIFPFQEYSWGELYRVEYELDAILGALKESIKFNDDLVLQKTDKINKISGEDAYLSSDADEASKAQYYGHHFGDLEMAISDLNHVLLNSNMLAIFAFFEGKLKEVCELVEEKIKSNLKHSDLRADGDINQIMKFLNLIFGMSLTNLKSDLDLIQDYKLIRNKIAHTNGVIFSQNVPRIKKIEHIRIVDYSNGRHGVLIDSSKYLLDLIKLIEAFFGKLINEVDLRMKQIENEKGSNIS